MKVLYIGHSTVFPLTKGPRWFDCGYLRLIKEVADQVRVLCPKMPPSFGDDVPGDLREMFPNSLGFEHQYSSKFESIYKDMPEYKEFFSYSGTYPLLFSINMIFNDTHNKKLREYIESFDPDVVISCIWLDREYYPIKKFIFMPIDYYPLATAEFFQAQGFFDDDSKRDKAAEIVKRMESFMQTRMGNADAFITGSSNDLSHMGDKRSLLLKPAVDSMDVPFKSDGFSRILYSGTYGWHRFVTGLRCLEKWALSYPEELRKRKIKFSIFCNTPTNVDEFFEYQFRKIKGMATENASYGIIPVEYATGYPTKELEYLAKGLIPIRPYGDFGAFLSQFDARSSADPRDFSKKAIASDIESGAKLLGAFLQAM